MVCQEMHKDGGIGLLINNVGTANEIPKGLDEMEEEEIEGECGILVHFIHLFMWFLFMRLSSLLCCHNLFVLTKLDDQILSHTRHDQLQHLQHGEHVPRGAQVHEGAQERLRGVHLLGQRQQHGTLPRHLQCHQVSVRVCVFAV